MNRNFSDIDAETVLKKQVISVDPKMDNILLENNLLLLQVSETVNTKNSGNKMEKPLNSQEVDGTDLATQYKKSMHLTNQQSFNTLIREQSQMNNN